MAESRERKLGSGRLAGGRVVCLVVVFGSEVGAKRDFKMEV